MSLIQNFPLGRTILDQSFPQYRISAMNIKHFSHSNYQFSDFYTTFSNSANKNFFYVKTLKMLNLVNSSFRTCFWKGGGLNQTLSSPWLTLIAQLPKDPSKDQNLKPFTCNGDLQMMFQNVILSIHYKTLRHARLIRNFKTNFLYWYCQFAFYDVGTDIVIQPELIL